MSEKNAKERVISAEGYKKLQEKLQYLTNERRAEVAEKLSIARGYGDLSENAEYDAAKNEQASLENEIVELEAMIRSAVVIDGEVSTDRVNIGTHVKIRFLDTNDDDEFDIVSVLESDPMENRISNESPIGAAIMGKEEGDSVTFETPDGNLSVMILQISKQ